MTAATFARATRSLLLAATVAGAAVVGLSAGPAAAQAPGPYCLWAGAAFAPGTQVHAGGWAFSCRSELFGAARWNADGPSHRADTVANPGALGNPAGRFSPGARQPGTSYNDYCVGDQLIAGTEDVYEAVPASGGLYWRAAGPISQWRFQGEGPAPTWRSSSLCRDGELL
ncbi:MULTISPECIES: hypothetical protein [Nocardia]|uniref:hypothetical protein n=1 Tax=Nocardia TaxID=1817 RepID=UPI0007E9761D|nr:MULTISPECIES: hypothetical protein [Nocardia]MBF6276455.1 hypothetical protein [Nocardia nova]OBA45950.1 hypothetical protein A5789_05500 [Nocardia sp. 852002-51101_SCH5132738]OBB38535.1 hypothetical protein A5748_02405 [Nocardia sp. 852002-51244_SCH5132740]OBF82990.1 hypothetical protein A9X06_18725 [Mycobacterium sp. 852002-51759_SCH5129042]